MEFIDDNSTVIGKAGETILFVIDSRGTSHLVTYQLDGAEIRSLGENQRLRFTFGEQQDRQRQLQMTFDFSESAGGEYEIRLIGGSREPKIHHVEQGSTAAIMQFTLFGLEGDPDTDAD